MIPAFVLIHVRQTIVFGLPVVEFKVFWWSYN